MNERTRLKAAMWMETHGQNYYDASLEGDRWVGGYHVETMAEDMVTTLPISKDVAEVCIECLEASQTSFGINLQVVLHEMSKSLQGVDWDDKHARYEFVELM